MDRGHEEEPLAIMAYEAEYFCTVDNGGFYEENSKTLLGWKKNTRLNSWGSMFALQAIYWINNYEKITLSDTLSFLY